MSLFYAKKKMSSQSNPFRNILDSISNEYEVLLESKTKLEADCQKLNDFIEIQIQQIQQLNMDFQKLKHEFALRQEQYSPKQMIAPPQTMLPPVPPVPQAIEEQQQQQQIQQQQAQMPPPPPPQQQPAEESAENNWEIVPLIPNVQSDISLLAEIVDVSVICSTAFSPDNTSLAIGSNKTLRVYNINDDQFLLQFVIEGPEEVSNHIRTVSWTPDSRFIIAGGEDHNIRIFDMGNKGNLIATFEAGEGEVFQLECSRSGNFFVAVTGDGALTVWDLSHDPAKRYTKLWQVKRETNDPNHKIIATSLSLSHNDRFVAVGYDDNYVAIWDLEAHSCAFSSETHTQGVYAIKFIPGDQKLATASLDSTVKLWNIRYTEKGIELELWRTLTGHTNYALCLAVDPTGKWLISGSKDLTAILTSLDKGEMVFAVKSHSNSIITVAFNSNGTMFATGSGDKSIKIWQFLAPE